MAEKEFDLDDPMELVGVALPEGDMEEMAVCLVEELIRDGWDDEGLLRVFSDPFYRTTYRISQEKGEDYVLALIGTLRRKWGYWKGGEEISRHLRLDEIKKLMLQDENPQRVEDTVGGKEVRSNG